MSHITTSQMAPRLARTVVAIVYCSLCTMGFLHVVWRDMGLLPTALSASYMLVLLALQLFYFSQPVAHLRSPTGYSMLGVQAVLVYLPLLQYQEAWIGMPGFLAGSVLLVMPFALAVPMFASVVVSMTVIQAILSVGDTIQIVYTTLSTLITGLVIYGLARLAALVSDLHSARGTLAKMAVAQERLRFARDLHDLLGYSLSAITLKSELTHQLIVSSPNQAQAELEEILTIARKALADVRSVARGRRVLSLEEETESVRSVLASVAVDTRVVLDYEELPAPVSTLLATILREGVTNILRHSKAEHCELRIHQNEDVVRLSLINDGVPEERVHGDFEGSGMRNLSERVNALGGELTGEVVRGNSYQLTVTVPITEEDDSDDDPTL